jgi:hypothetical protein
LAIAPHTAFLTAGSHAAPAGRVAVQVPGVPPLAPEQKSPAVQSQSLWHAAPAARRAWQVPVTLVPSVTQQAEVCRSQSSVDRLQDSPRVGGGSHVPVVLWLVGFTHSSWSAHSSLALQGSPRHAFERSHTMPPSDVALQVACPSHFFPFEQDSPIRAYGTHCPGQVAPLLQYERPAQSSSE